MQILIGLVVENKTPQTLAVEMTYSKKHAKYLKILTHKTKLLVHNELEGIKVGDKVKFAKSRPYSKRKHFITLEKV